MRARLKSVLVYETRLEFGWGNTSDCEWNSYFRGMAAPGSRGLTFKLAGPLQYDRIFLPRNPAVFRLHATRLTRSIKITAPCPL